MDNVNLFQDAVNVVIQVAGPMLLLGMTVGIVMALVQAVTQIHEQSLSFVLKAIVVILYLSLMGGWMMQVLQNFVYDVFAMMI